MRAVTCLYLHRPCIELLYGRYTGHFHRSKALAWLFFPLRRLPTTLGGYKRNGAGRCDHRVKGPRAATGNGSCRNFFRRPFVARLRFIQCPSRSRCGAPPALAPRWVDAQGAPPSTHVGRVARVQRVSEREQGHPVKRVLTPISVRGAHLVAMRQTWSGTGSLCAGRR